jgi:hypothetical protein
VSVASADWQDDWTVHYGIPAGGVELPVRGAPDPGPWAADTARERLGPGAPAELVTQLASALAAATLDARGRDPMSACFFCPDPAQGELARIEVSSLHPDEKFPELTVRQMADWLATPSERSVNPPEVVYGDLPIGPAARVRHQYVAADAGAGAAGATVAGPADGTADGTAGGSPDGSGDGSPDGEGTIMQTCTYATRPPEIGSVVLLTVSWRALAYSDRLFDLTDRLAEKLRLVRKEP